MAEAAFLLDTSICIYLLDGTSAAARARVEQEGPGALVTSAIAYAEVVRGLESLDELVRASLNRFFTVVRVVLFNEAAGLAYRDIPFQRGRFDHLIAAHALALGLTLVTNNERDFARVPGLRVENWACDVDDAG